MLTQISGGNTPKLISRYAKLDDEKLDAIEDLADKSLANTITSSALPLLCGLSIGAGVAALSGAPIVGAIAGSYFIYTAISGAIQKGKEAEYLKNQGLLAHTLPEAQLIQYAEIVGPDAVADEIADAYRDGEQITAAARKFLIAMGRTPQRRTISFFMDELKKLDLVEDLTLAPAATTETPATTYFNPQTGEGSCLLDAVIKSPGTSRLMIGGERTGKSYFAAAASRELANQGWKVYHVNIGSYGDEDSYYWQHATRSVVGDLASITEESVAVELIESAIACCNEFWAEEKAILIADEITYVGSKFGVWEKAVSPYLNLLAGRISALTSSGMKREKAIWALCPELVSGALKGPAKAIKSLKLMFFAIAPGREVIWNGQSVTFKPELYTQVSANFTTTMPTDEQIQLCNTHKIDRICFIDGTWIPVGELPVITAPTLPIPESPAAVLRAWGGANPYEVLAQGLSSMLLPQEADPAIDLINEIEDPDRREALTIAYQWAISKSESSGEIKRTDFLNRAKNERKCGYLKRHRHQIWDELETLIEG